MKFKMNNRNWEIVEIGHKDLLEAYRKEYGDAAYCFGLTIYNEQIIYLNREMHKDVKRQTLLHELMHCYVWNYVAKGLEITEEALCDITANSHYIIHDIVKKYFVDIGDFNKIKNGEGDD